MDEAEIHTDEMKDDKQPNELAAIIEDTKNLDGAYLSNGTLESKVDLYMLSAIATYSNIDGLHGL